MPSGVKGVTGLAHQNQEARLKEGKKGQREFFAGRRVSRAGAVKGKFLSDPFFPATSTPGHSESTSFYA